MTDIEGRVVVLKPGDRVLLVTSRFVDMEEASRTRSILDERFPDVDFTIASGYDNVLVQRSEAEK